MADNNKLELVVEVDVNKANASITSINSVREHHSHATRGAGHRLDHVLDPSGVAVLGRRHSGEVPALWVAGPDLVTPLFEREGRIGDDAIEGGEIVTGEERRLAKRVAANDLEIGGAMVTTAHCGAGSSPRRKTSPRPLSRG